MLLNIIVLLILVGILVVPIVLQYVLNWDLLFISVYGVYMLVYLIIEFLLAFINNKYGNRYTKVISLKNNICCNLMVVGWREKEEYFNMCLESIKMINMDKLNRVYIIVDGDEKEDEYMIDIAKKMFENRYIHIELKDISDETIISIVENVMSKKVIIVSKHHSGKRDSMYIAFKLSILEKNMYNRRLETIFCTDSDTVISETSIDEMILKFNNDIIGGVVGDLSIHNKYNSLITFMSKVRYWFAFNLERAYQSFNGCVLCVSGPLGMYRLKSIESIIDAWKDQKFLGKSCTYGDDRHLSNLILSLGEKIIYNSNVYGETETPDSIYRFYKQQVRWNKSSFREFFWSILNINKQNILMSIDLIYTLVYPFIVMGYLMYLLWYGSVFELGIYLNIVLIIGLIKSIYGVLVSGIYENLFYVFYCINYISVIFPARLWGLISISDINWGTSARKTGTNDISFDIIMLILWNMNLLCGLGYSLWRNREMGVIEWILLGVPLSFIVVGLVLMKIYISFRKNVLFNKDNKKD
jgi:hyaluronan synthase|uniref:Glycosyltransferase 2-like domain-containing protein n=1 Tax=viral metagenome TaxID=1070528 RepID=A0A6C0ALZ7_9ZZZZ